MSAPDSFTSNKFLTEEENMSRYKAYIKDNAEELKEKLMIITNPTDYPLSMTDGSLFHKFSIEFIKNIIFSKKGSKYKENIQFNFFGYIKLFTESRHSGNQKRLFEKIISFKEEKASPNDYMNMGDFDLIIESIKGENIINSLIRHKYNIYHYPGKEIEKEKTYCVLCQIKFNYFKQISDVNVKKQFKKYKLILELLSSEPNLGKIKRKIGMSEKNELIFMLATNGDFYQFDYMRYYSKKFKDDINTDVEYSDNIPGYLKIIDEISKVNIPILVLFVPETLDNSGAVYKNKYIKKLEKDVKDLREQMDELRNELSNQIKELKNDIRIRKEKEKNEDKELNKKRERDDNESNEL